MHAGREFIERIPKSDLHLHLDYLIRRLRSLQQRQQAASASDHPND